MINPEPGTGPETKSEFLEDQEQRERRQKEEMQKIQQELEQLDKVPEGTPLHQEVKDKAQAIWQQRQTKGEPGTPEQDFLQAIDQTKAEKNRALKSLEGQEEPVQVPEAPSRETKSVSEPAQPETVPGTEQTPEPRKEQQPEQEPALETKETPKSVRQAIQEAETAMAASGLEDLERKKQELTELENRISMLEKEIPELEQKTSGELEKTALSFVLSVPEIRLHYKRSSKGRGWRIKELAAAKIIHENIKDKSLREAILGLKDLAKGVKTQYRKEFGGELEQRAAKKEREPKKRKLRKQELAGVNV